MTQPTVRINGSLTKLGPEHAKLVEKINAATGAAVNEVPEAAAAKVKPKAERFRPAADDNKAPPPEPTTEAELLRKINAAVAEANDAEEFVKAARVESACHAKKVGRLLLEAKELHPTVKEFEAFLTKVKGLKRSRAYECMKIAGGHVTVEQVREATNDRVRKHRANKKLPDSVTETEKTGENTYGLIYLLINATMREHGCTRLVALHEIVRRVRRIADQEANKERCELKFHGTDIAANASAYALAEFTDTCDMYLRMLTVEADREKARLLVSELTSGKPKAEAA